MYFIFNKVLNWEFIILNDYKAQLINSSWKTIINQNINYLCDKVEK